MYLPDGFILKDGLVFWGTSFSRESYVARGYELRVPNLDIASNHILNEWHIRCRRMLSQLQDIGVQFQWSVGCDYSDELARQDAATERYTQSPQWNEWIDYTRQERHDRSIRTMQQGGLRRERLRVYLTRKLNSLPRRGLPTQEGFDRFAEQQVRNFDEKMNQLSRMLLDTVAIPLTEQDAMEEMHRFLNPSRIVRVGDRGHIRQGFDLNESILSNCLLSDGVQGRDPDGNIFFKLDEHYHTLLVLTRWGQPAIPLLMRQLTNTAHLDYCITQNILPLSIADELRREKKALKTLVNRAKREVGLDVQIRAKNDKINELNMGYTIPSRVLTVVRVWDRTVSGLVEKTSALKSAITAMGGTQYFQVNHPAQAVNLFNETLPGRTGGRVRHWDLYGENRYLADMLPVSSTFTGRLADGDVLMEGNSRNLVGLATFVGDTPQHAVLVGMTGSGKSVFLHDILSQAASSYDLIVLIEEGLSYGAFTQSQGSEPIILQIGGSLTLNYFDTLCLPLSDQHISSAVSLCMKMVGEGDSRSQDNLRASLLSEYINQVYTDNATDWMKANGDKMDDIRRFAIACEQHIPDLGNGATFLDAFVSLRTLGEQDSEALTKILADVGTPGEVLQLSKTTSASAIRNMVFAFYSPEEYPTHSVLVEIMQYVHGENSQLDQVRYIATMLTPWRAEGGRYGKLFDGVSNLNLTNSRVVHFELSGIPRDSVQLKEAASFLICNTMRQHIVTMPRSSRKCMIFEELARFKNFPGAETFVGETYAQLRKYGCFVISVLQQYDQLAGTALASTVFDNSRQFFLMRQNSAREIDHLIEALGLPETARTALEEFPLPDGKVATGPLATYVLLVQKHGSRIECGVLCNVPSEAMLYMAASGGDHFEKRRVILAGYSNVTMGILRESDIVAQQRRLLLQKAA